VRHLDYLAADDVMILQEGGSASLTDEQVREACHERGIDCADDVACGGAGVAAQRKHLDAWLSGVRTISAKHPSVTLTQAVIAAHVEDTAGQAGDWKKLQKIE
jgi:hypothetical protein